MSLSQKYPFNPGWKVLINDMGADHRQAMITTGLNPEDYTSSSALINGHTFYALWRAVEQEVGINQFSTKIIENLTFESLSPALYACLCSHNMQQAFERVQRYKPLIGPIKLGIEEGQESIRYQVCPCGNQQEIPKSLGVTEVGFLLQLARIATRQEITPVSINVTSIPDDSKVLSDLYGCPLKLGEYNELELSKRDLALPLLTENAIMWNALEKNLEDNLKQLKQHESLIDRTKLVIASKLPEGNTNMDSVAAELAMSSRTLQRKLKSEQTTYQDILHQTRQELATHYLTTSDAPLIEIAFLLGFQDNNSFSRAFSQWFHMTPNQYRSNYSA